MEDLETSLTSRLPARSRWVGSLTAAGLSVCDDKTKTIEASLAGSSKWEKLTSSLEKLEGAKSLKWEKSLAGTSKLVPHLEPELHEEVTVRFGRTGTMKEALAVLQEAAEEVLTIREEKGGKVRGEDAKAKESPEASLLEGNRVFAEEVAELRALLEQAIQPDEGKVATLRFDHETSNEPLESSLKKAESEAQGHPEPQSARAESASEDLYDSSLSGQAGEMLSASHVSWGVSSAGESLAYSHSGYGSLTEELQNLLESPKLSPKPAVDGTKIKAFASAVEGATGLGEDLQKDLLDLLQGLPGYKPS